MAVRGAPLGQADATPVRPPSKEEKAGWEQGLGLPMRGPDVSQ